MGKLIIVTYEGGYWGGIRKTKSLKCKSLKCKSEERALKIISRIGNVYKWRFYENTKESYKVKFNYVNPF